MTGCVLPGRCFTCGDRVIFVTADGRVVAQCPTCERRRAGLCRWCPRTRAGRSWYCRECRALERVLRGRRWYRQHAEEARAAFRRRLKAAGGRRGLRHHTPADPHCEVCGTAIPWLRRGRPPKRCIPHGGRVAVLAA